ncbi:MAG TPA: O-methyltransferase [Acidobacteriaceae bacterium]|nr:O-methyltransferase [Acidobacteriaceae bacterium]
MTKTGQELWTEVDRYITETIPHTDEQLEAAIAANHAAGLPMIDVSPPQGKLLHLLALACGARRVLEIGTLGGYSTIWMARALPPDGRLITLEVATKHADVARQNLVRAGVTSKVDIRVGPAAESLERLANEDAGPFDLIFIDADKPNNPVYWSWALKLARRGTVIVVDNVIREGAIADSKSNDPAILATRRMFEALGAERHVTATVVQTVGSKGYDGFVLAVVTGD